MKVQVTKCKPTIPRGTYVPSNLSYEERDKQFLLNNRNNMASKKEVLGRLGLEVKTDQAQPK